MHTIHKKQLRVTLLFVWLLSSWSNVPCETGMAHAETATYTCGTDYHPIDLTFAADGTLYSTSLKPTLGDRPTRNPTGRVYRHTETGCEGAQETWSFPFGLTTLGDGRVCVTHQPRVDTPSGRLPAYAQVSCWDGVRWQAYAREFSFEARGLVAAEGGMWVAAMFTTDAFKQGTVLFLDANGRVCDDCVQGQWRGNFEVQYVTVLSDGSLIATVCFRGGGLRCGTHLVRIARDGEITHLRRYFERTSAGTYANDLTGVVATGDTFWVANYFQETVTEFSAQGDERSVYHGLQGPMGLAQAPNGDLCVAEMLARHVRCFSLETLREN